MPADYRVCLVTAVLLAPDTRIAVRPLHPHHRLAPARRPAARYRDLGPGHYARHTDTSRKARGRERQLEARGYDVILTPARPSDPSAAANCIPPGQPRRQHAPRAPCAPHYRDHADLAEVVISWVR
jgi:hypothetical protein